MAWVSYSHASISITDPRPLAVCDRCGFAYNRGALRWQHDWAGAKEMNRGVLVCRSCMDLPQPQQKALKIPADPIAIMNPRPGEFSGMVISSSPDAFATIVPSQITVQKLVLLVTEGSSADITTEDGFDLSAAPPSPDLEIGDRSAIVTQSSSLPLLTEVTVTPNPDPNYMGTVGSAGRDGGYTRMPSSIGTMVST